MGPASTPQSYTGESLTGGLQKNHHVPSVTAASTELGTRGQISSNDKKENLVGEMTDVTELSKE